MSTLTRAIIIAAEAHAGATDRAGAPYILHPIRVMLQLDTEPERIAGVLHDVVEDCGGWSLDRLRAEGFSEEVLAALEALTRPKGERYRVFIRRAAANEIARRVKLADLRDNADLSRLPNPTIGDRERTAMYRKAIATLEGGRW